MVSYAWGRLLRWAAFLAGALLIPFLGGEITDEIQWEFTDYLIMGVVLAMIIFLYELLARRSRSTLYRAGFALGLVGLFLLFWVNGAVGLIGSEDQAVNQLFWIVFIIVLAGGIGSKVRAKGLSITMYTAAAAQLALPAIGLLIWPPPATSWSPGIFGVFLLCAFFAFLFFVSGRFFQKAAKYQKFKSIIS